MSLHLRGQAGTVGPRVTVEAAAPPGLLVTVAVAALLGAPVTAAAAAPVAPREAVAPLEISLATPALTAQRPRAASRRADAISQAPAR